MIAQSEIFKIIVQAYPPFRCHLVSTADDWIDDNGATLFYVVMANLTNILSNEMSNGNYQNTEAIFESIELLLNEGTEEVKNLVATGFLENMQNQTQIETSLWYPLLGTKSKEFCEEIDKFWGIEKAT